MAAVYRGFLDDYLERLVRVLALKIGEGEEPPGFVDEVVRYVEQHLGAYAWPGNVREIGNCVASIQHGGELVLRKVKRSIDRARLARWRGTRDD